VQIHWFSLGVAGERYSGASKGRHASEGRAKEEVNFMKKSNQKTFGPLRAAPPLS
jgi:hypothetical protein